jgi:guanylate kinase
MLGVGSLFIISAPSGAGKTSLVKALLNSFPNVRMSVSHTTRTPRPAERNGIDYHFTTQLGFEKMLQENSFLEHAKVFGHDYGTSKIWVEETLKNGEDVILEIDWQGARQIRKQFSEAISIFVLPPSLAVLTERLIKRFPDDASIATRMANAAEEISHWHEYDYIICNDDFGQALTEMKAVMQSNRLRYSKRKEVVEKLIQQLIC